MCPFRNIQLGKMHDIIGDIYRVKQSNNLYRLKCTHTLRQGVNH